MRRHLDSRIEEQRTTVAVPETEIRMHQDAEWRGVQALGALCPALEWPPGWPGERIKCSGTRRERQHLDRTARPAIEGIRLTVAELRGSTEYRPRLSRGESEQNERARVRSTGQRGDTVLRQWVEAAATDESNRRCAGSQSLVTQNFWIFHHRMMIHLAGDIMDNRQLGKVGPEVSQLGLGCMAMSGTYGPSDRTDIVPVMGARRRERLIESLGALDRKLPQPVLDEVEGSFPPGVAFGTRYPETAMAHLDSEVSQGRPEGPR
jgi:hypothetical protein